MQRLKPVDVVIVGGGFTGLLLAKELTQRTGVTVTILERGPARKNGEYAAGMDELDFAVRLKMMQNLANETLTHRHDSRASAVPVRQYGAFQPGTGTGGAGEHWGALSYRFDAETFRMASYLRERHAGSKLTENVSAGDWGTSYQEMEPYYWRSELLMGVCGRAGNLKGQKVAGGNIFEEPRQNEYPNPPHPHPYVTTVFQKAALESGYHPYPIPTATLSRTYKNPDGVTRAGCAYCGFCTRFGCMIGAKAQPTNLFLPLLGGKKKFTLYAGSQVRRVLHKDGQATGVTYTDAAGEEFEQPARVVVMASWTLNNARLLMLSKIGDMYDPATGKGTLGRNLTHQVSANIRFFLDKPLNTFMGSGGLGYGIDDHDGERAFDEKAGLLRGGTMRVQNSGEGPLAGFGRMPAGEAPKNWGSAWKKAALKWNDKSGQIAFEGGHFPYKQNYLDLDPTYTDKWGDPLIRLTLDWTDHERAQANMAIRVANELIRKMGGRQGDARGISKYSVTYYQSTHVQGGTIVGTSQETSVLNPWGQHWKMPNVWAMGGSTFPQSASGNPTLTILAMAYRTADAIIDKYLKHPAALA